MKKPSNAVIAVTLNCNSKCIMCDIWKTGGEDEVSPSFYKNLPPYLEDINITGGEPFLREDLPEIINTIKKQCVKARIVISTNGLLTEKIREKVKSILKIDQKIAIRISIDGLKKNHDDIRGVTDGFENAINTIEMLKEIDVKDLGIGLTISDKNISQIKPVYNLANKLGIEFSITSVTSSPIYFGEKKNLVPKNHDFLKQQFENLIKRELDSWNLKRWARAYYEQGLFEFMVSGTRTIPCDAGEGFFYLDSYGNVYPCNVVDSCIGNLKDNSFENIWHSDKAERVRTSVKKCNTCWMVCSAKTAIKKNIHKAALNVIKNRIKTAMGVQVL